MRTRSATPLALGLVVASALLPRLAAACPMCASQQPGGVARIIALGLMLLLPFSIAFVVFRLLRSAGERGGEDGSRGRAPEVGRERARIMRELRP